MSGGYQHLIGMMFQIFKVSFPVGPVNHTCLAESAAADAAPHDLKNDTVLGHLDKWNQRLFRVDHTAQIPDDLFFDHSRRFRDQRLKRCDRLIFMIRYLIKRRNIKSRDLRSLDKEIPAAASGCLMRLVSIHQTIINRFALTDIKNIKKIRQRFRIIHTWTAADHDRICLSSFG